jgi:hypothetical protein
MGGPTTRLSQAVTPTHPDHLRTKRGEGAQRRAAGAGLFDLRSVILRWPRKWPSKDAVEAHGSLFFEAPPIKSGSDLGMTETVFAEA